MTKSEAGTFGRIIKEVCNLSLQFLEVKTELNQVKRSMVALLDNQRRLVAEKATLMEAVARLTLRAHGLPIVDEVSRAQSSEESYAKASWGCVACGHSNSIIEYKCFECGTPRFMPAAAKEPG